MPLERAQKVMQNSYKKQSLKISTSGDIALLSFSGNPGVDKTVKTFEKFYELLALLLNAFVSSHYLSIGW